MLNETTVWNNSSRTTLVQPQISTTALKNSSTMLEETNIWNNGSKTVLKQY